MKKLIVISALLLNSLTAQALFSGTPSKDKPALSYLERAFIWAGKFAGAYGGAKLGRKVGAGIDTKMVGNRKYKVRWGKLGVNEDYITLSKMGGNAIGNTWWLWGKADEKLNALSHGLVSLSVVGKYYYMGSMYAAHKVFSESKGYKKTALDAFTAGMEKYDMKPPLYDEIFNEDTDSKGKVWDFVLGEFKDKMNSENLEEKAKENIWSFAKAANKTAHQGLAVATDLVSEIKAQSAKEADEKASKDGMVYVGEFLDKHYAMKKEDAIREGLYHARVAVGKTGMFKNAGYTAGLWYGWKYGGIAAEKLLLLRYKISAHTMAICRQANINPGQYSAILQATDKEDLDAMEQGLEASYKERFGKNWRQRVYDLLYKYKNYPEYVFKQGVNKKSSDLQKDELRILQLGAALRAVYEKKKFNEANTVRSATKFYKMLGITPDPQIGQNNEK